MKFKSSYTRIDANVEQRGLRKDVSGSRSPERGQKCALGQRAPSSGSEDQDTSFRREDKDTSFGSEDQDTKFTVGPIIVQTPTRLISISLIILLFAVIALLLNAVAIISIAENVNESNITFTSGLIHRFHSRLKVYGNNGNIYKVANEETQIVKDK